MLEARQLAAGLEQNHVAFDVAAQIGVGIDQRIAHPGLGRQVNDPVDVGMRVEQRPDRVPVGDIEAPKGEPVPALQKVQPRLLERHVVVVVEVVDPDHPFAPRQQSLRGMKPDKSGDPGDQHRHGRQPPCLQRNQ